MNKAEKIPEDMAAQHYLYAGALFVHPLPHIVSTVLGSCVSVCLWDKKLQIGGINHYQLALWNGEGLASPRYGNISNIKLIEKLENLGSRRKDLVAKVFGGSSVIQNTSSILKVGEKNIDIAIKCMEDAGIPIIAKDVGGTKGRKLKFHTGTGVVLMKRLESSKKIFENKQLQ